MFRWYKKFKKSTKKRQSYNQKAKWHVFMVHGVYNMLRCV